MRRLSWWRVLWLAPVLALATIGMLGCNSSDTKPADGGGDKAATHVKKGEAKELESKGWGTLKGKVTLKGAAPDAVIAKLDTDLKTAINNSKDKAQCLAGDATEGEKSEQAWKIGKDGGVENVVVFLRPPEGHYFKIDMANKTWPDEVVLHQPHCAFLPHVTTLFPKYQDGKTKGGKSTGQKFVIKNDAKMSHNTNWKGSPTKNAGDNKILPEGGHIDVTLEPDYSEPVALKCDIHTWMNGYIWVLDHPYAAVTKEDGTYEIKNVPAGAEVHICCWQEEAKFVNQGGSKGETITLKEGDNTKDFTVTPK